MTASSTPPHPLVLGGSNHPMLPGDLTADERLEARARLCVKLDQVLADRKRVVAPLDAVLQEPHVRAVIDQPLNHLGDTALHKAVRSPRGLNVIRSLLRHGAHPDLRDNLGQGRTALLICLDEVVPTSHLMALLDAGANPNVPGPTGDNALGRLLQAGESPDPGILRGLLDAGANPHQPNHNGLTPMTLAIDDGLDWVVEAFVEHEARQLHAAGATPSNAAPDRPSMGRARL